MDERLLSGQAVCRLLEDDRPGSVDHRRSNLLAAVGWQAVHEDRVARRVRNQLGRDLVVVEGGDAVGALGILAHRHPDVGIDRPARL